jgi:uncharacterized phiE125 gp8 family phage protein
MLDLELVTEPSETGLDVVSLDELASHLRLSATLRTKQSWIDIMTQAINEVVDKLHGPEGELNRTILPCQWKLHFSRWPASGKPIQLPFPPIISVDAVTIADGAVVVPPGDYIVTNSLIREIFPTSTWPTITNGTRALSVTFTAGYETYPDKLKRLVKIMAAHYIENPEATINEPRQMAVNRKVDFGVESLRSALRVPVSYDDWNC